MLDPVYYAVSAVMWFWHEVFGLLLGPTSGAAWALSVVFLVLTLRAVMIKPFLAQVRSGRAMRALAPRLAELRERHADDRARLVMETRALQSEHGVSPVGGILSALLQVPVFLGLLHVLRCFSRPGLSFEQNAAIPNYAFGAADVRSFLEARLFGAPLSAYPSQPQELLDALGGSVDRWEVAVVAGPLALIAAVAIHFSTRHSMRQQPLDGPAAGILPWLPWIFPLGVLLGAAFFPFPIAILVYGLTTSAWVLVQQWIVFGKTDAQPVHQAGGATREDGLPRGTGGAMSPVPGTPPAVDVPAPVPRPSGDRVAHAVPARRTPPRRRRRRRR